ncbi:MAG: hypothetical protein JNM07_01630 [Phycisphaerae bacterium]|nr:hypothetical protein [Phycisphaerae bacterium]
MPVNRIKPLEQHFEKIIVGVAGAALLGVLAWQFVGQGSKVKVGKDEVDLSGAYKPLEATATRVLADLKNENPALPDVPAEKIKDVRADFDARYRGPVAPAPQIAGAVFGRGLETTAPEAIKAGATYAAVLLPAPRDPVGHAYISTLDPNELKRVPELAAFVPKAAPFDKVFVSVQASVDGRAIKEAIGKDPDGEGPMSPIPSKWWERATQVLRVDLLRQELLPDGKWGEEKAIPTLPGNYGLTAEIEKSIRTTADMQAVVQQAAKAQELILRPEYYATISGEEWREPALLAADVDPAQIERLKNDLARLDVEIAAIEDKINKAGGSKPPGGGRNERDTGSGGGGGGGGGGKGGPQDSQPSVPTTTPSGPNIAALQSSLNRNKALRVKAIEELAKLGVQIEEKPTSVGARETVRPLAKPFLEDEAVKLWAHDITVQRGKTYRYRLRYEITNPFFARQAVLSPEQAKLAERPLVASPPSEWATPVPVWDDAYYFITSAQERDSLGRGGKAMAELYQVHWGYWRKASAEVAPGDALTAQAQVPDMEKIVAALAVKPTDETPGERGGRPGSAPPDSSPSPPGEPGKTGEKSEKTPMKRLTLAADAIVLDVNAIPGSDAGSGNAKASSQVYLRDASGRIVRRTPEGDRGSDIFKSISRNAQMGEAAFAPKEPKKPAPKPNLDTPRPPPVDDHGGGGGGGGGGG